MPHLSKRPWVLGTQSLLLVENSKQSDSKKKLVTGWENIDCESRNPCKTSECVALADAKCQTQTTTGNLTFTYKWGGRTDLTSDDIRRSPFWESRARAPSSWSPTKTINERYASDEKSPALKRVPTGKGGFPGGNYQFNNWHWCLGW